MSTKICTKCGKRRSVEQFRVRGDGQQGSCKPCRREYDKQHYQKRKELYEARNARRRERVWKWFEKLKDKPCVDCGKKYPPCAMEFDHRDGEEKTEAVSNLVRALKTKAAREEIKKCDLVCCLCHRLRTHRRRVEKGGWC